MTDSSYTNSFMDNVKTYNKPISLFQKFKKSIYKALNTVIELGLLILVILMFILLILAILAILILIACLLATIFGWFVVISIVICTVLGIIFD